MKCVDFFIIVFLSLFSVLIQLFLYCWHGPWVLLPLFYLWQQTSPFQEHETNKPIFKTCMDWLTLYFRSLRKLAEAHNGSIMLQVLSLTTDLSSYSYQEPDLSNYCSRDIGLLALAKSSWWEDYPSPSCLPFLQTRMFPIFLCILLIIGKYTELDFNLIKPAFRDEEPPWTIWSL